MKRWENKTNTLIENEKADLFLKDIIEICIKICKLSLAYEDIGGGFIIDNYNLDNINWLNGASISENCTKI